MSHAAVIGTGVIGAGWVARLLAQGHDVIAWDPGAEAERKLRESVDTAWPALEKIGLVEGASKERLRFASSLAQACEGAYFIQENAPEREAMKVDLLADISRAAPASALIGSSTSGFKPSVLQQKMEAPERFVVSHPFNPVYLLPLVEVVGGEHTSEETIERAMTFFKDIGMHPLHVRNEIDGHLSDRLLEAVWREILHLVNDGVATTGELDQAITYGPGLRWAFMGTNLTYHLAGGETGMRHMLEQFGPALKLPWTKLEAPELNDQLIDRMVEGTQEQAGDQSIRELESLRDQCLVRIMEALSEYEVGAGKVLAEHREKHRLSSGSQ
ncbi:3-hydroxybutyryl-CoA dehydrogenase [Microbulbifer flavimaris]|uniref:L-carnitine dehydrogenase n=1 Tax=Microbulbifer flavimaris TaxID=1781068 RepID=A0ABX4HXU4_9GAMM|nr:MULTISPECIES: L-carnitine dehydrogenase [Microbulbifer]KUJ81576.1 3-hydroxybutyryl-CoA dehydrogenase [Microbulbifer sp. ZGT114]PCO04480.1 3-hydroxybutyryl-CoA dehydrogenase [Microbulbifer flavimaris]